MWAIHPSAWKGNSANFTLTEFSRVRMLRATGLWLLEDQGQDECEHHDARDGVHDDPDQCAAVAP
jgi:hypothetical protein